MERTKLPTFKGKPLIEITAPIPQIGYLEGEGNFGKAFLEEYQGKAKADYRNASALNVLSYSNGLVRGSNPFAVVLANQILRQAGLRVATQGELELAMKIGAMNFGGTYEDTGLVLRTEDNPNEYLAKNLMTQIKARNKKQKLPVMIPLAGLELRTDSNSPHGMTFSLREDSEIIYSPVLNKPGNFKSEDIDQKTGLPIKLSGGNRTLYTTNSGLSGLFLVSGLYLVSGSDNLALSFDYGRVVVVSTAEGGSQDFFNGKLAKLQKA